jgi:hypothetical protein
MKVFVSWSGPRSHAVAEALRDWLPCVINSVEPWLSSSDIEKGARWGPDIARELEASRAGIICLTPENLRAPWILFEAGALSKTLDSTFVCPYLYDLQPADVGQPLGQFQSTMTNKCDTQRLVHTLNRALGEESLPRERVDKIYDKWWPDLERALEQIPLREDDVPEKNVQRSDRELLEEILGLIRGQERRQRRDLTDDPQGDLLPDSDAFAPWSLPADVLEAAKTARGRRAKNSLLTQMVQGPGSTRDRAAKGVSRGIKDLKDSEAP